MAAAAPDTPLAHSPAVGVLARDHIERRSSSDFIERGASPLGVVTATLPLGDGPLGGAVEGALLGMIAALAVAASGVGAEFIYFQF